MKNIKNYEAEKYKTDAYEEEETGIYVMYKKSEKHKLEAISETELAEFNKDAEWVKEVEISNQRRGFYKFSYKGNVYVKTPAMGSKESSIMREVASDNMDKYYVTSLVFEQEPEYGENANNEIISQYPLEDIMEKFSVFGMDSYTNENYEDTEKCYYEFASSNLDNIRNLRTIIGKHVYNKEDGEYVKLIIE